MEFERNITWEAVDAAWRDRRKRNRRMARSPGQLDSGCISKWLGYQLQLTSPQLPAQT